MYRGVTAYGVLESQTPPCPRCGSFMYFPREKDAVRFRKCRDCGYTRKTGKPSLWNRLRRWFKWSEI